MSFVASASLDVNINGGSDRQLSVATPVIGSLRGWDSVHSLVIDLFGRVADGTDEVFARNDIVEGSDPNVELVNTPGVSYNDVRNAMHSVWAEADSSGRQDDSNWLQARFTSIFGQGVRLVSTGSSRIPGVFRATVSTTLPAGRTVGNRNGGRTGVRGGNVSFLSTTKGQTADIRSMLVTDGQDLRDILEGDNDWCLEVPVSGHEWKKLTPQESIEKIASCGCVLMGLWVRFSKCPVAALIVERLLHGARSKEEGTGYKFSRTVSNAKTRLLYKMATVIARSRRVDPDVYWREHMGSPVIDTEIYAICKAFKIDLMVIQAGAYADYLAMTSKENQGVLVSHANEIEAYERDMQDVRVMIRFNGRDRTNTKFDRRDGSSMFMICSYLADTDAHVDTVFDPNVEANILGKRYSKFVYEVTYDASENGRANEGYFDRLLTEVVPNDFTPKRVHAGLEGIDLEKAIKPTKTIMPTYIDNAKDFKILLRRTVRAVAQLYDGEEDEDSEDGDSDNDSQSSLEEVQQSFYETCVFIDEDVVRGVAQDMFDMEENNINGIVYYFGAFYNALERAGLHNKIDFTGFRSTMSRSRTAKVFSKQLGMDRDNNRRVDCMSSFDDLNHFTIRLLNPIKSDMFGEQTFSPRFIVQVGTYSKVNVKVGRAFVAQQWVQKMITNKRYEMAKKTCSDILDPVSKNAAVRECVARMVGYKKVTDELLAVSISRESIVLAMLHRPTRSIKAITKINRVFGTYAPVRDEIVHMYDPQIDEAVVPIGKLSNTPLPADGHWEMDANFFYTQVLMGRFDDMMCRDFYGQPWMNGSPRRAVLHTMEYNKGEFLGSYEADFGYAWIDGISFALLRTHMGFNELNSWWRFALGNPERVERRVPVASVIHITSYIVRILLERKQDYISGCRPWLYEMTKEEMWVYIQESVLNIRHVYFYHLDDQRTAIKRFSAHSHAHPSSKTKMDDKMKGIPVREMVKDSSEYLQGVFSSLYSDYYELLSKTDIFDTDEQGKRVPARVREAAMRKEVKSGCNKSIGLLKTGKFMGSVKLRTTTDVINLTRSADGELEVYTYQGIPFPKESFTQVCTRELPNTDKVLSEMVFVTPIVLAGHPRSLRIDILERARHAMDLFTINSGAFMVKTDAVFFKDDHLERIYAYLADTFPEMLTDNTDSIPTEEDIRDARDACISNGCRMNKFCVEHAPWVINETTAETMLPVKFVWHPGLTEGIEGQAINNVVEDGEDRMRGVEPDDNPTYRKLSPEGREELTKTLKPIAAPVYIKTSELMPSFEELAEHGGLTPSSCQYMNEDPTIFVDRIEEHCHVYGRDQGVFLGEDGNAQYYDIDNELRNEMYMHKILDTIDGFGDKGFLMEGPPGAGKTYAVCEYIKREYASAQNTAFFVATATHLTLAPYKQLTEFAGEAPGANSNTISVCTVHSLIGVFNQMEDACANPSGWLSDKENKFRSRFMRMTAPREIKRSVIFIDEYEMLPLCMEEMILYLSDRTNTRVILLGDRYQTAAFGRGIRCGGDVIKNVTNDCCIEFDLPFRNPDYEYNMAQRKAVNGQPTLFLDPILSDYRAIGSRSSSVYTDEIDRIAVAYHAAAVQGVVYRDPVVSLQNYKAIGVVTIDIMARLEELGYFGTHELVPFCGTTHFGMGEKSTGDLGSVDDEVDEVVHESGYQNRIGESNFCTRVNHLEGDPSSKLFLVGTQMSYKKMYSYRSISAFTPKLCGQDKERFMVKQEPVRMGQVFMFQGMHTSNFVDGSTKGSKRKKLSVTYGIFTTEPNSDGKCRRLLLLQREMQAYMYYPFCLYTEGVVGHTFDRYTMIKFSNNTIYKHDYAPLKRSIEQVEKILGDTSWVTPIAKTMNVAVSRLTKGNKLRIIEINEGRAGFWKTTLNNSKWHIVSEFDKRTDKDAYRDKLRGIRNMVVESTHGVHIANSLCTL
jgi:hypothetical protein